MDTHKSKVVLGRRGTSRASGLNPVLGYDPDGIIERSSSEPGGFFGTCETTLTDWIQLVQMGRRDAVVSIRTHDDREGTLWCRQGNIIDASCDGLAGEAAVYRALSWQGGKVSVDFGVFKRRRKIQMTTAGLLLGAAFRKDSGVQEPEDPQGLPASPTPPPEPGAQTRTVTLQSPYPAWLKRRRPTKMLLFAGGMLALVLLFGLASKWRLPARSEGKTLEGPVSEFLVRIDVDPANAAILLDGKKVGVGRLNKSLPRDGRLHEIVCSAPGYVSQRCTFDDTPPRQHVTLLRNGSSVEDGELSALEDQPSVGAAKAKGVPARRRGVTIQARQPRANMASPTISEMPRESGPGKVNIQTIEERRPRVQVIGEREPLVQMIQ